MAKIAKRRFDLKKADRWTVWDGFAEGRTFTAHVTELDARGNEIPGRETEITEEKLASPRAALERLNDEARKRLAEGYVEVREGEPEEEAAPPAKPSKSTKAAPPAWLADGAPALQDQRRRIAKLVDAAGLAHRRQDIESLLRCAIRLEARKAKPAEVKAAASRLGGLPDLPPDVAWPKSGKVPLAFVGQVRLEDVAGCDPQKLLPKAGLLSFFLQASPDEDDYLETARVLFSEKTDGLRRADPPKDLPGEPFAPRSVKPSPDLRLPPPGGPVTESLKLTDDEKKRYWDEVFMKRLPKPPSHRLLGYPDMTTQFSIDEDTELLLQVDSEGDMEFGDAQPVLFYIARKALLARDFKKTKVTAQEE